jgi:hypothetical protein
LQPTRAALIYSSGAKRIGNQSLSTREQFSRSEHAEKNDATAVAAGAMDVNGKFLQHSAVILLRGLPHNNQLNFRGL